MDAASRNVFTASESPVFDARVAPSGGGTVGQRSVVGIPTTLTTLHDHRSALDNTVSRGTGGLVEGTATRHGPLMRLAFAFCGSRESQTESNLSSPLD